MGNRDHVRIKMIKYEKSYVEPTSTLPGVEMLYEKYSRDNPFVRNGLSLWEKHQEVSLEQALVQMVDALAQHNEALQKIALDMMQRDTRPITIMVQSKD